MPARWPEDAEVLPQTVLRTAIRTGREDAEEFKRYRGYDPKPYLPVFAGRIVGSAEVSERFLHDYRKTVADCMAENTMAIGRTCRRHGMETPARQGDRVGRAPCAWMV